MAPIIIDLDSIGEGATRTGKAGIDSIQWQYKGWFAVVITKDSSNTESDELLVTTSTPLVATSRPPANPSGSIYSTGVYAIQNKDGSTDDFHAHYYYTPGAVPTSPLKVDDHGEGHYDVASGPPSNTVIVSTP